LTWGVTVGVPPAAIVADSFSVPPTPMLSAPGGLEQAGAEANPEFPAPEAVGDHHPCLDHHLARGHVQPGEQFAHLLDLLRRVGDDERVGLEFVGGAAALGQHLLVGVALAGLRGLRRGGVAAQPLRLRRAVDGAVAGRVEEGAGGEAIEHGLRFVGPHVVQLDELGGQRLEVGDLALGLEFEFFLGQQFVLRRDPR
jgi:hypothetical protein